MRTPIASALLVVFALVFFAHFAAAQSGPIPSQPQSPQQTPQEPPAAAQLLPPPVTEFPLLANQPDSANDLTRQERRNWIRALQNQKNGLAMNLQKFGSGPDAPNCAHIRIFQAPEMDSEMVLQTPPGDGGPITTYQGLPPCRRDLPAPMTAQGFHGKPMLPAPPRKPFVLPPASQFPSSQPILQPKQGTSIPKP